MPEGRIWAGTWGGGLFVQNRDRFEFAPGMTQRHHAHAGSVDARATAALWIGTADGLLHYERGRTNWFT